MRSEGARAGGVVVVRRAADKWVVAGLLLMVFVCMVVKMGTAIAKGRTGRVTMAVQAGGWHALSVDGRLFHLQVRRRVAHGTSCPGPAVLLLALGPEPCARSVEPQLAQLDHRHGLFPRIASPVSAFLV